MKRIVGIVYVFLCWGISLHAQSVRVIETLKKLEMENISVVEKSDTITAAFETSVYRGAYNGIGIAIRHLVAMPEMPTLQLVILDNALPQLCITLPAKLVQQYQSGEYTLDEVYRNMEMTTSTGTAMRRLKGIKREDSTFGKVDLVLYPGVMLVNNVTYKLYKAALDLQPALEMQLWKGASLRMQVSLPIVNNEEGKWDCVRLGFMTLRQDFRLANHWKGYLTGGNFSDDRMGVAAGVGYFSANGRWTVEGEGGITGSSHFYGSKWEMSKWKRINGRLSVGYYVPEVNTLVKVEGARFHVISANILWVYMVCIRTGQRMQGLTSLFRCRGRNANGMHCGLCFPNILLFSMICVVGMNTPTVLWGKVIIPSLGLSRIHVSGNRIIFAII